MLDRKGLACAGGGRIWEPELASFTRTRCSGTLSTGRTITSSVICGRPAHTLASVTSAWMLPAVRRLSASRSFGSCSVTSFSVMLSDGQMPILVPPLMVSL